MSIFEVLIVTLTFGVGYFIGKNIKKTPAKKDAKYASLKQNDPESCDEVYDTFNNLTFKNEMNLIQVKNYFANEDLEKNQKSMDKLMQELSEAKKREKKYQAEIEILKAQTKAQRNLSKSGEEAVPLKRKELINKELDDLINDQELNSLIDASTGLESNEVIDTGITILNTRIQHQIDKLTKEIEDDLEGDYLA